MFWVASLQRLDEDQRIQRLCVLFGDRKFEVKVSEGMSDMELKFGDLSFIGGGNYISETEMPTTLTLSSQWSLGQPVMAANVNGKGVIVQVFP